MANKSRNAWSIPPDSLFVTIGLVNFADSQSELKPKADDVLAFVLGHEWTHILQGDYERSERIQQLTSEQSVAGVSIRSGLGRFAEVNADRQGLLFAYRSGYSPYSAVEWCDATIGEEGDSESSGDHPSLRERKSLMLSFLDGQMLQAYHSFEQGVKAFSDGDINKAIRLFEAYAQFFPNDGAVLQNLGTLYFLKGASLLKEVPWMPWRLAQDIQKEPELSPFTTREISVTIETRRWWERASHQAYILLGLNPDSSSAYQILGDVSLGLGERQKAEDLYNKGLLIDTLNINLKNNLGVLYAINGDIAKAHEIWTSIQSLSIAQQNLNVHK